MSKKAKIDSEPQTERFQMRASPAFMQKVEDWRATQRPIPSLSDAIRILVETNPEIAGAIRDQRAAGLEAEAAKKGKKR